MTVIDISSRIGRSPTAIAAEIDDQLVALDVEKGVCYGLNAVATRIWALIESPRSATELCDQLTADYDVDRSTCEAETVALLQDLVNAGLAHLA